jgi:type I pantothenate kinase
MAAMASHGAALPSPYVELDRDGWARLRAQHPMRLDIAEVEQVYLPLSRLLSFYERAIEGLHQVTSDFLGERPERTPFVIGVAGSVAVGKSTTARILRELIARWESKPVVELITTDGFLFPNAELERRNLMSRKGYPESYDRRALLRFVTDVKAGRDEVEAPVYSHLTYDIVPGQKVVVRRPDVLIVEGLNVLQAPRQQHDFSVYVDAKMSDIKSWYVDRFLTLRETAFSQPESFFRRYASLSDDAAQDIAENIWDAINAPNLVQNIRPTRGRATLVLTKGEDHKVTRVRLRRL